VEPKLGSENARTQRIAGWLDEVALAREP